VLYKIQKFQVNGLSLNARVWGPDSGLPVLGMHGWLDNAATFDRMAPFLPGLRLVSVDFPGHGFSDFLPPYVSYSNIDRALQMFQLADVLGWKEFSIMGHSLGGIVGEIMAAIAPDRIKKIALIDVFGGLSKPADTIIAQLRNHLRVKEGELVHSVYLTLEDAAIMRARVNLTRQLSVEGARVLAEGGMQKVPGGYSWTFDTRLQLPTPIILTDDQLKTILHHFTSDCALILGDQGILHEYQGHSMLREYKQFGWNNEVFPHVQVHELEGGHHLHLDTPEPVAKILAEFFEID
jgi:pimeloyl-ACP methyl ester carboxylesterase